MSSVLPAEGDLRRVIGDGAAIPDGEVDGLSHDDLLALYRNLVLLRTYDERSVIYHRQGRIGTYAIFWNHEAMQAGSVFALEDRDWIFPSYRESAIGLLRGIPASTVSQWWRGHPTGWWNPEEHNVASICVPIGTHVPHAVGFAWGARLKGEDRVAIDVTSATARRRREPCHEGATFAGVMQAPVDPLLQQQPVGDLDAALRADGGADARRQGDRLRDARRARRRRRCPRRLRGDARRSRAGAGRRRPDVHRSRVLPRRAACDRGRSVDLHRPRASRGGDDENECVGRFERYLRRVGVLTDELRRRSRPRRSSSCAPGSPPPRQSQPADPALVFEHAYADPPPSQAHDLAELRRLLGG